MTDFNARFDVHASASFGDYTRARDPNGNLINYCYRFWGGDANNHGTVTVSKSHDGDSRLIIPFDPVNDSHYKIQGVKFWSDPSKLPQYLLPSGPTNQFDFQIAADRRSVTLYDRVVTNNGAPGLNFYYSIMVNDTRPGQDPSLMIMCDPTIHNTTVP